ncbi:hypothetical protein CC78DRAFT_358140 [Lojkania enalia]|uniref:Uncharacterized protein n=1 Tax=Lojkania enalia TaxID=147567 RepID=A0A9P4K1P1_9PLEO|nr:hypothetical protein CC78DRAFT_358140 [Didymosphaeria enalia]
MASLPILPILLLLPLPLILPTKKKSIPAFYESLREMPRLPPSPTLFDRVRYIVHKAYFRYLVTAGGYVLEPVERICVDLFVMVLVCATVYCAVLFSPMVVKLLDWIGTGSLVGLKNSAIDRGHEEALRKLSGNMSLSVRTVVGTASAVRANGTKILGA